MKALKKIRKKYNLTLRELGEKLGITPQGIRFIENTGIKKVATAKRYAEALGCDWRELLD